MVVGVIIVGFGLLFLIVSECLTKVLFWRGAILFCLC